VVGANGLGLSVSGLEMALWDIAGRSPADVHELWRPTSYPYASGGTGAGRSKAIAQAQLYGSLGFRGLKIGTGFDGRPGGDPPGTPPYGTWYAAAPRPVSVEQAKFGALRGRSDRHRAGDRRRRRSTSRGRSTALNLARA
jgi:L-alanine-DL-glutamate epimerase-like enolase superfamily enzyme